MGWTRFRCASGFIVAASRASDLLQVSRWFDEGKLTPVLDTTYPLAEVAKALEHQRTGNVRGKLAISIE